MTALRDTISDYRMELWGNLEDIQALAVSLTIAPLAFAVAGILLNPAPFVSVPCGIFGGLMLLLAVWCDLEIDVRDAAMAESEREIF